MPHLKKHVKMDMPFKEVTMMYKKEQRWELEYVSLKDGSVKHCYPRSEEKKNEQLAFCKEKGIKVNHCKKLYPFNMEKNQHNFDLIHNICLNRIHDICCMGEKEQYDGELERLEEMAELTEKLFCLPLPIAWIPWEVWKDAKEVSQMAIIHRQNACIANGRPDLVTYC